MVRNYKRKTVDRWTFADLTDAMESIHSQKMKLNAAANFYGISRATLYRHQRRYSEGIWGPEKYRVCGGNPILSKMEENVLANLIDDMRKNRGFTVTCNDIKRICYEYCEAHSIPNKFNPEKRLASDDWYYGFLKRHPEVDIRDKTKIMKKKSKFVANNSDGNLSQVDLSDESGESSKFRIGDDSFEAAASSMEAFDYSEVCQIQLDCSANSSSQETSTGIVSSQEMSTGIASPQTESASDTSSTSSPIDKKKSEKTQKSKPPKKQTRHRMSRGKGKGKGHTAW